MSRIKFKFGRGLIIETPKSVSEFDELFDSQDYSYLSEEPTDEADDDRFDLSNWEDENIDEPLKNNKFDIGDEEDDDIIDWFR